MAKKQIDEEKTLTEQWRDGTLLMGYYYVSTHPSYGGEAIEYLDDDCSFGLSEGITQEVLAPVPSYDEYVELLKKIDELKKELSDAKEYCDYSIKNREQLTKQINYWMDKSKQHERSLDRAKQSLVEIRELAYKGGHPIEALDKILDISSEIIRQLNQDLG